MSFFCGTAAADQTAKCPRIVFRRAVFVCSLLQNFPYLVKKFLWDDSLALAFVKLAGITK